MLDTFSHPEAVGETARLLSGAVGAHGYVSGISTYHPDGPTVVDEDAPLRRPGDAAEDDPLQARSIAKISCEEAASRCFSGPVVTTRVGIMVGPRDPTDRFSWWPVRLAEDGEVLAPGDPKRPVQFSDARDIAAWVVGMLAAGTSGTYNAVGPGCDVPISQVLDACRLAADEENSGEAGSVEMTWAAEEFLREQLREMPEEERPLWFPEDQIPFQKVDSSQALAAGLTFQPPYETARDTLAWVRSRPPDREAASLAPVSPPVSNASCCDAGTHGVANYVVCRFKPCGRDLRTSGRSP